MHEAALLSDEATEAVAEAASKGDYTCPVENVPRSNFDDLLMGFTTVFQILTGENWNTVMYDGIRGSDSSANWGAVCYFMGLVIIGDFIVLNLFIAILLGNFENADDEEDEGREAAAAGPGGRRPPARRRR